ncbi:succinate dehydrogenase, hydrophobic membrane anchor protein [Allofrancisella guangzhouensis]|nr:succinate dehydrogenase, hydrophobic membrane anchor protein [Allofrancisella guangzhouensis]MBK2026598.1 succinate dehydrogenase, hydrophobic membrane anchor protein [Allofrancisella guangzhouensis]MBK2044342.1 succinate dehydrogenase, hydrophobic membrane anchor protein [Allofrancisella guangzhouensis]MBK2045585.1 succinate dehydrogenase, hydrophobic membrane anchor protein [Allofrancisella guangzhouensis]
MGVLFMAVISLTSSGVKDFFVQRVTAVIIAVYFAYILIEALCLYNAGALNYDSWHGLFTDGMFLRILTLMAYLSVFLHAWVGLWIICGDYIKCAWASATIMLSFILVYVFCFFWLFAILFFY